MDLGENMMLIRKKKKLSQAALGKMIRTSGDLVRRYEREDITPSFDVVAKIAATLEVIIDYQIGKTKLQLDKEAIERLESISDLSKENKKFVLKMIDMVLRGFKAKELI